MGFVIKLSKQLLAYALKATLHDGYSSFFPAPPELSIVKDNWPTLKNHLADLDLDTYEPYSQIWTFAPKSRLNVRRVGLLHPCDQIIYTALVLALKKPISAARLNATQVFSYRTEGTSLDKLYASAPSWKEFREAAREKASGGAVSFVGVTDIADFYPRIYQHRLVNALEAASTPKERGYIRALEKMLSHFSEGRSYGIPVGPPASRLLGEAVLIDVDSTLTSFGINFIRYVDDVVIFASTAKEAEYGLRILGETLFTNHGLTLQTAKTKVLTAPDFVEHQLTLHNEKEVNRRKLLDVFGEGYEIVPYENLSEEQKREIDAFNLSEMLTDALGEGENVDYREVSFVLGRLSALKKPELIPIVLDNLDRLYPVADAVAAFFREFSSLGESTRTTIADAVLAPILNAQEAKPSEYYSVWMLSIFQHAMWNHASHLIRIFRETSSDTVRRFAALALAVAGTRTEAVAMRSHLANASPLSRTAILLATAKLGRDERNHLKRSLKLTDPLEKFCITSSISN